MKISLKFIYKSVLICCLFTTFSCKKMFEVDPANQVDVENHYRDVYDANAAVIGIYGQLLGIADRYIVLNELRADLMSPTANADQYLKQLNSHTVTTDNPWADPKPFYKIILNCNDAMAHFDTMLAEAKLNSSDYQQRYSDVGAIRAWLYLQLGIHFGSVPYVTDPLASISDLKDESKYPKISFDQLLDKLIAFLGDQNRYLDVYSATATATGASNTSLNTSINGYPGDRFFINKRILLGDLYLWKGNYTEASRNYRYMTSNEYTANTNAADVNRYSRYKVIDGFFTISYGNGNQNLNSLAYGSNTGWASMFMGDNRISDNITNMSNEWLWTLPFDRSYSPGNPFVDLFSNQGGRYLLTASQAVMDMWNSQTQINNFPFDARGQLSVRTINGQPVIAKQLYYYLNINTLLPNNILQKPGRWLIYRTGTMNLHFAEAACNDNQIKIAYALTNVGIRTLFTTGVSATDKRTFQPAPYDMDARDQVDFYRQIGTRTRAYVQPYPATLYTNNDKIGMENAIIEEGALEGAFEGNRWPDILRVALRRNDPSFVADKVFNKLQKEGNPGAAAAKAKLLSPGGLYLPFKL